jgi:hypothetical protein
MKNLLLLLLAAAALALVGCGGGGGGSASNADAGFFATDNLSDNYDGVWVTIRKVQLRKADDTFVTIFDNAIGKVVNLRALNDGAERYEFFGEDSVPQGTYTGLRVELDRDVVLYPTGETVGLNRVFDDAYGSDRARLDLIFGSAKTVGPGGLNFICDFDLSAWEDVGGEIRNAIIDDSPGNGMNDPNRHENEDYDGRISGLEGTAPNFNFVLISESNNKLEVETNSDTVVFNNNGQPNPTLTNGKRIEVRGKFNPTSGKLLATSIKIKGTGDDDEFEVKGEPSMANAAARTFKVTTRECDGFIPQGTVVNVVVDDTTRFFGEHGLILTEAQFFELLPVDGDLEVEAEGAIYNAETNTLTARKCKIEHEGGGEEGHEAEARGVPSNLLPEPGTFDITLTSWEGFSATAGQIIHITTNGETEYKDGNNENITKGAFFELLATATTVKVEGRYENGTIAANELSLRVNSGGGGGEDPHEIKGSPTEIDLETRSFTVSLVEWFGFNGTIGQQIHVVMNSDATYRDNNGETLTKEQFFAKLNLGWLAEVEGTVSGSNMAGVKAKLDDH